MTRTETKKTPTGTRKNDALKKATSGHIDKTRHGAGTDDSHHLEKDT